MQGIDLGPPETKKEYLKIHTISFEELKARAEAGETLVSREGYVLQSRDQKWDERRAMNLWMSDLDYMNKNGWRKEDKPVINKKGKPFSWSPSAINDYITCPMQYAAKRFYMTLPYVESEAMRQGTIEHKFLEDRIKLKTPLPEDYNRGEKYCRAYEASAAKGGGELFAERQIAISEDMQIVDWFDKKAWGRVIIDLTLVLPKKIVIGDYKTGKQKDNILQLKVGMCALALIYPDIETFSGRYIWLKDDTTSPKGDEGVFTRDQIPELWAEILGHTKRMKQAWESEVFEPRSSGLCRAWCDVVSCIHCGKGKR